MNNEPERIENESSDTADEKLDIEVSTGSESEVLPEEKEPSDKEKKPSGAFGFLRSAFDYIEILAVSVIAVLLGIGLLNSFIEYEWLRNILSWISIYSRFGNFQNGLFDFASILYYASICFIFVFLTVRVYEKRRWN